MIFWDGDTTIYGLEVPFVDVKWYGLAYIKKVLSCLKICQNYVSP